jgi:Ca2+-binding EF-hand superfamily protein
MMMEFDVDRGGSVDIDEFVEIMTGGGDEFDFKGD